jgi:FixJ family two-component response regulator
LEFAARSRSFYKRKYNFFDTATITTLLESTSCCLSIPPCKLFWSSVMMISIIDDDASVRAATYRLVRSLGYVAHTFASADAFLRSSQLNDTCCVIADVHMPGMSGIELQNLLQTQGHRLPIIFITAFPEESVRAQALEAGAACFLSKPFDAGTLIKYVDAAVKSHGGRSGM